MKRGPSRSCGLVWDKARPWEEGLSWQTQGGRVKWSPGAGRVRTVAFLSILNLL